MPVSEILREEVERRFGSFPPFLALAQQTPQVLENLWRQTLLGYLDNPLPALFKEKLLAWLSRYCRSPYCIVVHSCCLYALGVSAPQVLALLQQPTPSKLRIQQAMAVLKTATADRPTEDLAGSSPYAQAVFCAAAGLFLDHDLAPDCRETLRQTLDAAAYEHLIALLGYIKTYHLWAQGHPQLAYEEDRRTRHRLAAMQRQAPLLTQFFETYARQVRRELGGEATGELAACRDLNLPSHLLNAVLLAPFPIMIYAEDGRILQINEAWTQFTGYTADDLPTVSAWLSKAIQGVEAWCGEDVASLDGWAERVDEGEYEITTKDGSKRTCELSCAYLGRLPDGRRAVMRMAVDLSDRKRLEQALWETNRKVINILEAITDGFFALDRQWRFLYLNHQAELIMHLQREHLIGQTFWDAFPQTLDLAFAKALRTAVREKRVIHTEQSCQMAERCFEFHIYPSPEGVSVYFCDVTERRLVEQALRQNENRLQSLVENLPAAVVALDGRCRVTLWSPAAQRLFGWMESEILGQPLPLFPEATGGQFQSILLEGMRLSGIPVACRRKDGSEVQVRLAMAPVGDGEGQIRSFLGVFMEAGTHQ